MPVWLKEGQWVSSEGLGPCCLSPLLWFLLLRVLLGLGKLGWGTQALSPGAERQLR